MVHSLVSTLDQLQPARWVLDMNGVRDLASAFTLYSNG